MASIPIELPAAPYLHCIYPVFFTSHLLFSKVAGLGNPKTVFKIEERPLFASFSLCFRRILTISILNCIYGFHLYIHFVLPGKVKELENMHAEMRRAKKTENLHLQEIADRVPTLEDQVLDLETKNGVLKTSLKELNEVLIKYVCKENLQTSTSTDSSITKLHTMRGTSLSMQNANNAEFVSPREVENDFKDSQLKDQEIEEYKNSISSKLGRIHRNILINNAMGYCNYRASSYASTKRMRFRRKQLTTPDER